MPHVSFDNVRIIVIVFIVLLVIAGPNSSTPLISTGPAGGKARLARLRQALGVLNSAEWGDLSPDKPKGYLNLTGFREDDGYAWEDLDRFRGRCREWSRNAFSTSYLDYEDGGTGEGNGDWEKGQDQITWLNATGTVFGEWVRQPGTVERHSTDYNLSAIAPGLGWPTGHTEWDRNITGRHGTVMVRLDEDAESLEDEEEVEKGKKPRPSDLVRQIKAHVEFQDVASRTSNWDMRLYGVHWPRQGAILLSTTSEKFAGIFGLPHLAPAEGFFNSSKQLLNKTIHDVLDRRDKSWSSDPNSPWTSEISGVEDPWSLTPQCEYVMYLQLSSIKSTLHRGVLSDIGDIENELRHPTGAPIGRLPDLRMSLVAWSPDCSYFLESKGPPHYAAVDGQHLVGMKEEILVYVASRWTLTFGAVLMGQLWLLKTQLREANTPSTIGRVSFYTASTMLLADGIVFSAASAWSLSAITSLLPCLVVTFASFMLMVLGGNFLSEVYRIQEPERRSRERPPNNTPGTTTPPAAPAENNTLPRPVTAGPPRAPSPPIIIPSDQDIDAEIAEATATGAAAVPSALPQTNTTTANNTTNNRPPRAVATSFTSMIGYFVMSGTFLLFLTAASSSWPASIRAFYLNAVAFLYFSLWIPQIWRNIQRNSRRAFSWRFMVGQSVLRLIPFAYFYLVEENFLFSKTDRRTFAFLCGWIWIQLCVLCFQDVLGPRFGVPKGWLPEAWDYHPILREDNLESGLLPIGLIGASSPTLSRDGGSERTRSWSIGQSSNKTDTSRDRDRERDKERERSGISMRCIDCAICREVLEVPVVRAGAEEPPSVSGVAGVLARRAYMVTPCRHIFHTVCLDGWLKFRLQCPICREELPPL